MINVHANHGEEMSFVSSNLWKNQQAIMKNLRLFLLQLVFCECAKLFDFPLFLNKQGNQWNFESGKRILVHIKNHLHFLKYLLQVPISPIAPSRIDRKSARTSSGTSEFPLPTLIFKNFRPSSWAN